MRFGGVDQSAISGKTSQGSMTDREYPGVIDTGFAQKAGWLIALSRVLVAGLILLMSVTDPQDTSLAIMLHHPDDAWAFSYVVAALVSLGLFHASWYWAYRLRPIAAGIDGLFYLGMMIWIEPMDSGFFAATFAMLTFLVISVNLGWSWKHGLYVLVGANLICIAMIAQMHFAGMAMDESVMIRRQAYLAALTLFLLLITLRYRNISVPRFSMDIGEDQDVQLLAALRYARTQLSARGGAICWGWLGLPECEAQYDGTLRFSQPECAACGMEFVPTVGAATMFAVDRRLAVTIEGNGRFKEIPIDSLDLEFIGRARVREGIFIPLIGASGRGRLLLSDVGFMDVGQLLLATAVTEELQRHLDTVALHQAAEQVAMMDLREVIARDLHDSVAQSLAGTRFWLQSLERPDGRLEIDPAQFDAISEALQQEHASLREVIDGLQLGEFGEHRVDLVAQIKLATAPLSGLWNMEITIESADNSLLVDQVFARGVLQILKEAASNAARHGRATRLVIALSAASNNLKVTIADNGAGFIHGDEAKLPKSIGKRAAQMGGAIELRSGPDNTQIILQLPIGKD